MRAKQRIFWIVAQILSPFGITCPFCKKGIIKLRNEKDDNSCVVSCNRCEGIWNIGRVLEKVMLTRSIQNIKTKGVK